MVDLVEEGARGGWRVRDFGCGGPGDVALGAAGGAGGVWGRHVVGQVGRDMVL